MLSIVRADEARYATQPDFDVLRRREFARLDAHDHAYLDFTGSALYPASLVTEHQVFLRDAVLGNPHAENPASFASTDIIDNARQRVLRYLDADPSTYVVVFTANTTAALGLVGSAFPFGADAPLVLTADNHNSVNGIREFAKRANARVHYLPLGNELRLREPERILAEVDGAGLFAFPAQSNFSGVKHDLSLVTYAKSLGHRVLLDAAALLPMARLSLRRIPADFVALSFYKMFGYPTGVGALVARRDALEQLKRLWFSGGTVDFASVQNDVHGLRHGSASFEDGTPNFIGIAAVPAGLSYLESIGVPHIDAHARMLAMQLIEALTSRRHGNGARIADVYGPVTAVGRGATVAFNLYDRQGKCIAYPLVEKRAQSVGVSVRGGCFCNPGASEAAFRFPAEEAARCLAAARRKGWSIARFAECLPDYPVGAVRASFGAPSNRRDLDRLLAVIESFSFS